jgi:hypothetical protein
MVLAFPGVAAAETPAVFLPMRIVASNDGGDTFRPVAPEDLTAGIVRIAADGKMLYAAYDDDASGDEQRSMQFRRSFDQGRTWSRVGRLDRLAGDLTEFGDSGESDMVTADGVVHVTWEDDVRLTTPYTVGPAGLDLDKYLIDANGKRYEEGLVADGLGLPPGTVLPAGTLDPCCDSRYAGVENSDEIWYVHGRERGWKLVHGQPIARNVSSSPHNHDRDPVLAVHGDLVAIAYESERSGTPGVDEDEDVDIMLARSLDGGRTWTDTGVDLTTGMNPDGRPNPGRNGIQDESAIAMDGSALHVAFRNRGTGIDLDPPVETFQSNLQRIGYARIADAASPGPITASVMNLPVPEPAADYTSETTPAILAQGDVVHVLACHEDEDDSGEGNALLWWRSTDGGRTWADARVIDRAEGPCNRPVLAGVGDRVSAAYERDVDDVSDIFLVQTTNAGRTWRPAKNLSQTPGKSSDPSLAVNPGDPGSVYVAWTDKPPKPPKPPEAPDQDEPPDPPASP